VLIQYISVKNTFLQSNEIFLTIEQTEGATSFLATTFSFKYARTHAYAVQHPQN